MVYLFLVLVICLLVLFLLATLKIEISIVNSLPRLRLDIGWTLFGRHIVIPLWRSGLISLSMPKREAEAVVKSPTVPNLASITGVFLRKLLPRTAVRLIGTMTVGTGDAAETGLLVGVIYQLVGLANAVLATFLKDGGISLKIKPNFNALCFEISISCIVSLPVFHIITAMVNTIWYWHNVKPDIDQGGKKKWQSIPFKG
ncbi:MAG: DUF2953 domain-containing protein [bacterium]